MNSEPLTAIASIGLATEPSRAAPTTPAPARATAPARDVIDDTIPSAPPPEVTAQVDATAKVIDNLRAQGRELHFELDPRLGRVRIEVRDFEGRVLRAIPPSEALSLAIGDALSKEELRMAGFSVGGLASGLDTSSTIEQLMAVERQPPVRLDLREKQAEARKPALNDVASLQGVEDFLKGIGTGLGFAQTFENVLSPLTQTGGTIDGRATSTDSEIARLKDSMTAMDARLALKEERLRAQFAALEKAMSSSQQQGSWLSGQLASLAAA